MITVNKDRYWSNLVDYYYDNIHWTTPNLKSQTTLPSWLQKEYSVRQSKDGHSLEFTDPKKYTYFMLRWS